MCIDGHYKLLHRNWVGKGNSSCLFDIFLIPSHPLMDGDGIIEILTHVQKMQILIFLLYPRENEIICP